MPILLDSSSFRRRMRRLHAHELGVYVAKVINGTAFEAQIAVKVAAATTFDFAGAPTRNFLAGKGSFLVFPATPTRRRATVFARSTLGGKNSTDSILSDHQFGNRISARDGSHLSFDGMLAIPVAVKRTSRGKIAARDLPWTSVGGRSGQFKKRSRAYRAGNAIIGKTETGETEVLFALVNSVKLRPVFQFYAVIEAAVRTWLVIKARQKFPSITRT